MKISFLGMMGAAALGLGLSATMGGAASATPADGFDFVQIGKDGSGCQLVMSSSTSKPVTRWDRKKDKVFGIAVGNKCPQVYTTGGVNLDLSVFPTYSVANRVFTLYSAKGDKMVFYKAYGERYNFRWIPAPKPVTPPAAPAPAKI
ncbi:hypothetical protein [Kaistia algarum]|uniref:hypothetical protein n=1 Tax=Kaistia algarum TaxID=2083279 RepID=UPI00224D67BB|nr:hypothetical protein [Kaistia algarum]MCX5514876.1 hypothetical protein [Kaistia algarum]